MSTISELLGQIQASTALGVELTRAQYSVLHDLKQELAVVCGHPIVVNDHWVWATCRTCGTMELANSVFFKNSRHVRG